MCKGDYNPKSYNLMARLCFEPRNDKWGHFDYKVVRDPYAANFGLYCSVRLIYKILNKIVYFWIPSNLVYETYLRLFSTDGIIQCFPATIIVKYLLDIASVDFGCGTYSYWTSNIRGDRLRLLFLIICQEYRDCMWYRRIMSLKLGAVGVQVSNELGMGNWLLYDKKMISNLLWSDSEH